MAVDRLSKHQPGALWFRHRVAKLTGGIDPEAHSILYVAERVFLRVAVGHAAREFGCFRNGNAIGIAPVDYNFILIL